MTRKSSKDTWQSYGDQLFDHLALALTDFGHVNRDGTRHRAEACGVVYQVRDFRAPDLVLARKTVDVGAGAADGARSMACEMRGGGGQQRLAGRPPHDLGNVALDHVYRQNNADLTEEHVTDYGNLINRRGKVYCE